MNDLSVQGLLLPEQVGLCLTSEYSPVLHDISEADSFFQVMTSIGLYNVGTISFQLKLETEQFSETSYNIIYPRRLNKLLLFIKSKHAVFQFLTDRS
jgi:hypothetical protein